MKNLEQELLKDFVKELKNGYLNFTLTVTEERKLKTFIVKALLRQREAIAKEITAILMNHQMTPEGRLRLISDVIQKLKK